MARQNQEQSLEGLRHEYSEVCQNFRHYSALRFAMMTVFFATVGGLATVAFPDKQASFGFLNTAARIGGLTITLTFFLLEVILEGYLRHYAGVAMKLEQSLGYSQFSTRPRFRGLRTKHATWTIYALLAVFWAYILLFSI